MVDDDVLRKAKELLERSAALQRELEEFDQREAEYSHALGQSMTESSATPDLGKEDSHTD